MVLEKLGSILKDTMNKVASAIFVDETLLNDILKDLRRALLEADVPLELVNQLSDSIRKKALEEKDSLKKKEIVINLIHDEIVRILGNEKKEFIIKKPAKILFVGLYGAGKTTTIAKLALYLSKRGYRVAMLGLDVHRPAAPEQLEQLGAQAKVPVFIDKTEKNPIKIYEKFSSQLEKYDVVLIDSAGRDALEKSLIQEIKELEKTISPQHVILVMAADIGKSAKKQASEFKSSCNIDGVIITRMDGTAKGGGALVACAETNAPVLFICTGEKLHDIEIFNPTSFVSRMLGMGDLESLIEKAKSVIEKEKQAHMEKRLEEGKFTLLDLYEQLKTMQSMGPLGKIAELIPGLGAAKLPQELLESQSEKMKRWKFAIDSMTKDEIENPKLLEEETQRIARISKGSNVSASEIRELLKQYKMARDLLKSGIATNGMPSMGRGGIPAGLNKKELMKMAKKLGKF
jgi:signal recognition particle subunit SRP54